MLLPPRWRLGESVPYLWGVVWDWPRNRNGIGAAMQDSLLLTILEKLDGLQAAVDALSVAQGKRRADPAWLPIRDAAALAGLSVVGLQTRLKRLAARPDGPSLRRRHGAVHRRDFEAWLSSLATSETRGARIRRAVDSILEG